MKNVKRVNLLFGICIVLFLIPMCFIRCTEDVYDPNGPHSNNKNQLDVDSIFDFATTHEAKVNIDYKVNYSVAFEVYTTNPISMNESKDYVKDTTLVPVIKGYTKSDGKISLPWGNKPDVVTEIYVYSPMLGVPRVIHASAEGDVIHVSNEENNVTLRNAILTRGSSKGAYYTNWPVQNIAYKSFSTWDQTGRPANLLNQTITLSDKAERVIDATLPRPEEGEMNPYGYLREYIHISEDANVMLYFYSHNSGRKNVLAYYTYEGDGSNTPSLEYINSNLILLYPNLNGTVKKGTGIQLKYYDGKNFVDRFPAGTNIGWVMLVDAFKGGQIDTKNVNAIYSPQRYNRYNMKHSLMANRPHTAMFKADNRYVLAFEDQPWGNAYTTSGSIEKSYPADFRDDIFIIDANPIQSLPVPPNGNDPIDPDLSGGIPITSKGVLAFEDLWPSKGDYDMNDVVIDYNIIDYMTYDGDMSGFEGTFTFTHDGAQRKNGFGFQLETNTNNVSYINITSDYQCEGQGLDPSLSKATIILFDDGKKVPLGTTFKVKVAYKEPIVYFGSGYKAAPYNPFIVIGNAGLQQANRTECHLVNYKPTEKANMDLLGTVDDYSNANKGIYYISNINFPFAISLPNVEGFVGAKETSRIDELYPDFNKWVESKGTTNKDWYLHPVK